MRVWVAIVLTAAGVLVGGLAAGAVFNSLFFHRFLVNTYDARLLTVALNVRDVFARAVALGLPLGHFDGGNQVVGEARKADPAITEIVIFQSGPSGFVSLGHGGAEAGRPLPDDWSRAMRRAPNGRYWQVDGPAGFGVLVPIDSTFGKTVGLAAFLQSRSVVAQPRARFDGFLALVALGGGLPGAVILLVALPLMVRRSLSRLDGWAGYADRLVACAEGRGPLPDPPLPATATDHPLLDEIVAEPLAQLRAELAGRPQP